MPMVGKRLFAAAVLILSSTLCRAAAPDFNDESASADAYYTAAWVVDTGDNRGRSFAIVDKQGARLYVFEPDGRLIGATSVLLGLTPGDASTPGIEHRSPASLTPAERTTPAGRFATQPGRNDKGEEIVWVDYAASLAIHRLRPAPAYEHRAARLASADTDDKRISFGCIVVPVAFYESVVATSLGIRRGVVYVLPENSSVQAMFGAPATTAEVSPDLR
jgi:hypothetical protein